MAKSIKDLLLEEMQDIYHAEQQLTQALPKMAQAATSPQLRQAFESHLKETQNQVERLKQAFQAIGEQPKAKACVAMQGLVSEAEELLQEGLPGELQDAGLIVAAQKVEHYEIAGYGSLVALAQACNLTDAARLFNETLSEEKATDEKLTQLACNEINPKAAQAAA